MRKILRLLVLTPVATLVLLAGNTAVAGGLVDIEDLFHPSIFGDPTEIDNDYWPLIPGTYFIYFAETEDGCEWNIVDVTDEPMQIDGIDVVVVVDMEWSYEPEGDTECSEDDYDPPLYDPTDRTNTNLWPPGELTEYTLDYYAQDDGGNVWYFGEDTWSFDYEEGECDGFLDDGNELGMEGCTLGSFLHGQPGTIDPSTTAQAGIVMLADPEKGDFYQQEMDVENAEDWGKVLNFIPLESDVFDQAEEEDCLKTKEWTPLERGEVEHKFYCPGEDEEEDGLLLLIAELSGGPTIFVELVFVSDNYLP